MTTTSSLPSASVCTITTPASRARRKGEYTMPMGWVAAAGLASAAIGAEASQSASGAQVGAANRATDATMGMFGQQQANLAPWMTEGKLALSDLGKFAGVTGGPGGVDMTAPGAQMFTPSSLFIDPSYDFLRKGQ